MDGIVEGTHRGAVNAGWETVANSANISRSEQQQMASAFNVV